MKLPTALFALAAFLCASRAARALENGPAPNASEKNWVAGCVAKNDDEREAMKACAGKIMGGCLDPQDLPKNVTSSDKHGHPRSCAAVEEKIWDERLNKWYADALKVVPGEAKEKLREAQRAWLAYREARCGVESLRHPFPLGEDNRALCAMEETARRALEIRTIATDGYE